MSDRDAILGHERRLQSLREDYRRNLEAFLADDTGGADARKVALRSLHSSGLDYFNEFEALLATASRLDEDCDETWYSNKAETAANLLETIVRHYVTVRAKAAELELATVQLDPSITAFATTQRLVRDTNPTIATALREQFAANDLPTHGFDNPATPKRGSQTMEWRWFIVGAALLLVAVAFAGWSFSLGELTPDQRQILLWVLPLASGFAAGAFAGSFSVKARHIVPGLLISATGGFGVWLLSFYLLFPPEKVQPQTSEQSFVGPSEPVDFMATTENPGVQASIEGTVVAARDHLTVRISSGTLSFPAAAPDGGGRYIPYLRAALAEASDSSWRTVRKGPKIPVNAPLPVGGSIDLEAQEVALPTRGLDSLATQRLLFEIAIAPREGGDVGFTYAHADDDLF